MFPLTLTYGVAKTIPELQMSFMYHKSTFKKKLSINSMFDIK